MTVAFSKSRPLDYFSESGRESRRDGREEGAPPSRRSRRPVFHGWDLELGPADVAHLAPHGLDVYDQEAVDKLPEDGVPDILVDMVLLQQASGTVEGVEVQHLLGPAEAIPPHPCRLCPDMYARETDFAAHKRRDHGGEDRYRARGVYEAQHPRPPGCHCGPLRFVDADGESCDERAEGALPCPDRHPAERKLYEEYYAAGGWKTEEARAVALQAMTATGMRRRAGLMESKLRCRTLGGEPLTLPWSGSEGAGGKGYDPNDLYVGETVLWTGGPACEKQPCGCGCTRPYLRASIRSIDGAHKTVIFKDGKPTDESRPTEVELEAGDERRGARTVWAGLAEVHRLESNRQVACVACARRGWYRPRNFVIRRLWDVRFQQGQNEEGAEEDKGARCWYEPDVRHGADGERQQRELAWLLSPVRYHNRFPRTTCLAELLRSCVLVPWWEARLLGAHWCAARGSTVRLFRN